FRKIIRREPGALPKGIPANYDVSPPPCIARSMVWYSAVSKLRQTRWRNFSAHIAEFISFVCVGVRSHSQRDEVRHEQRRLVFRDQVGPRISWTRHRS